MKLLYECLILNFEAIRKICKKFDKKLQNFLNKNSFCVFYLKALIDYHNSDLSYLLKMQIIEQGLILIQNRVAYLIDRKNNLLKDPEKKNKYKNEDYKELSEADIIKEIDANLEKTNDIIEGMITNDKYTITNINLGLILRYDGEYQNDFFGDNPNNEKLLDNDYKINEYAIDYDNEHINSLLKKEEMLSVARMFINKDIYKKIGGFDSYTFMYYEEAIMAERMRAVEARLYYADWFKVTHVHNASPKSVDTEAFLRREYYRSARYYCKEYLHASSIKLALSKIVFEILMVFYVPERFVIKLVSDIRNK